MLFMILLRLELVYIFEDQFKMIIDSGCISTDIIRRSKNDLMWDQRHPTMRLWNAYKYISKLVDIPIKTNCFPNNTNYITNLSKRQAIKLYQQLGLRKYMS